MTRRKTVVAMVAGSFIVHVAASCTSAKLDEAAKTQAVEDALADLGIDSPGIDDALADAFRDVSPTDALAADAATDVTIAPDAKTDPPPVVSGTRLRARYTVEKSGDGAMRRTFAGWYDTARKEPCAARTATDGKLRCLPSAAPQLAPQILGEPYYADSTCTTIVTVAALGTCGESLQYVGTPDVVTPACSYPRTLFKVGAKISAPTFYRKSSTGCVTSGSPFSGTTPDLYEARAVAPTEFAEIVATEEIE